MLVPQGSLRHTKAPDSGDRSQMPDGHFARDRHYHFRFSVMIYANKQELSEGLHIPLSLVDELVSLMIRSSTTDDLLKVSSPALQKHVAYWGIYFWPKQNESEMPTL
jgi:hypothetical protein